MMENLSLNNKENKKEKLIASSSFNLFNSIFTITIKYTAVFVAMLIFLFIISLFIFSFPSIKHYGLKIIYGTNWDPSSNEFGALSIILGTLITSILAIIMSIPFSFGIAIFLGEFHRDGLFSNLLSSSIELLAGIPSIIYGTWALYILVPLIQKWQLTMVDKGVIPMGVGIFTASLVLAIMIIPYSASISREIIKLTPHDLKEAAYSLGSTRFSMIKNVILPYCSSGIFAGILLSFGRALGETMAVTMVIGNMNVMPVSIFSPGNTIASVIANEFAEASNLHIAALTEIGLILFIITVMFSFLGRLIINKITIK